MKFSKVLSGLALAAAFSAATSASAQSPRGVGGSDLGSAQLNAVVSAAGSKSAIQSKGDTTCAGAGGNCRTGVGVYVIPFARHIGACTYVATLGLHGAGGVPQPGFVTVMRHATNPMAVQVNTFGTNGVAANRGFHLQIDC